MDFAYIFSQLRRESGKSQRTAAQEMHISQALLSHYENGVREPRLEFVARACDYYGVSADYMLGRTGIPRNPAAAGPDEPGCTAAALLACAGGEETDASVRRALDEAALLVCLAAGEDVDPDAAADPLFRQRCAAAMSFFAAGALGGAAKRYAALDEDGRGALRAAARRGARETGELFRQEETENR